MLPARACARSLQPVLLLNMVLSLSAFLTGLMFQCNLTPNRASHIMLPDSSFHIPEQHDVGIPEK